MDRLSVDLKNVSVELPETHMIIEKENYHHLKRQASIGSYMTLNDVLKLLSVSRPWLLEHVLYNPIIRRQIDIDISRDGFVKYPETQGGRYYFLASQTKEFFESHFKEIFG